MNKELYRKAAEIVAAEPVSIEPDGSVWADKDGRIIDAAEIENELAKLEQASAEQQAADKAAREAAIAHAKSLGFTDEMIAVMYPSLGASDA